jgi:hypothetical protein
VIVQVTGSAYRITAKNMSTLLDRCPVLRKRLLHYEQDIAARRRRLPPATGCTTPTREWRGGF